MAFRLPTARKILLIFFLGVIINNLGSASDRRDEDWQQALACVASQEHQAYLMIGKELLAQSKDSLTLGRAHYLHGEYFYSQGEQTKALAYLQKAADYLSNSTDSLALSETCLIMGFCYYDNKKYNLANRFYKKCLAIRQKIYGQYHQKVSNIYFNLGTSTYHLQDIDSSRYFYEKGLDILKKTYPEENLEFADFYEEIASCYYETGNVAKAMELLSRAKIIKEKELDELDYSLFFTYDYLGRLNLKIGAYATGIDYLKRAYKIHKKASNQPTREQSYLLYFIGVAYLNLGEQQLAYQYFDKSLADNTFSRYVQRNIPYLKALKGNEKFEIKWTYLEESLNIIQRQKKSFPKDTEGAIKVLLNKQSDIYTSMVQMLLEQGQLKKARECLQKANQLIPLIKKQKEQIFNFYLVKASLLTAERKYEKAIEAFAKAGAIIKNQEDKTTLNFSELKKNLLLNNSYKQLFQQRWKEKKNPDDLIATDSLLSESTVIIEYLLRYHDNSHDQANRFESHYQLFSEAIKTKHQLALLLKEPAYTEEAFLLAEASKSLVFLNNLKRANPKHIQGIPESILQKEQNLKINITYLENKLYEQKNENNGTTQQLQDQITKEKRKYEQLLDKIRTDYPQYHQFRYQPKKIAVEEIQQKVLKPDHALVEYFLDQDSSHHYVFVMTADTLVMQPLIGGLDLPSAIRQFTQNIYSYRTRGESYQLYKNKGGEHQYVQTASQLYNYLIDPIVSLLPKKLTIIPDGILGYLPFEGLVSSVDNSTKSIEHCEFFFDKHQLSLAYSANWLCQQMKNSPVAYQHQFVGFAPEFPKDNSIDGSIEQFRTGLGPLKHNQKEVIELAKLLKGRAFTGSRATIKSFWENVFSAHIVHLATHGKANDLQGDYSYLAFSEPLNDTKVDFLYVRDLYNYRIPAELVVLSACETGLGEIRSGEGIVGVGTGFSYAGANSLLTTLWRVNDNSTSLLMPLFYQNLKNGLPKDEALWKAKQKLIEKYPDTVHPFFWAGYVIYGNTSPMDLQSPISWWKIVFAILVLTGIVLFIKNGFSKLFGSKQKTIHSVE